MLAKSFCWGEQNFAAVHQAVDGVVLSVLLQKVHGIFFCEALLLFPAPFKSDSCVLMTDL